MRPRRRPGVFTAVGVRTGRVTMVMAATLRRGATGVSDRRRVGRGVVVTAAARRVEDRVHPAGAEGEAQNDRREQQVAEEGHCMIISKLGSPVNAARSRALDSP